MLRLRLIILIAWTIVIAGSTIATAQVPSGMTYQGCLTDSSGMPLTDTTVIVFSIHAQPEGGLPLWSETLPVAPDSRGIFTVILGHQTAFPSDLFNGQPLYLGLTLDAHNEMIPRQTLTSVPYAIHTDIGEIDPTQVRGHAAVLNENQTFYGVNCFEQSVSVNGGSATSYALRGDNRQGGVGVQAQTNSDNHPALLVLTGLVDLSPEGDALGTGPLIEAWSSTYETSPPQTTFHRRLLVENDGSIKSGSSFEGGRSGYAEMMPIAPGSTVPEEGDVMVIDRNFPGNIAVCETSRSTCVAGLCMTSACFVSCSQTTSPVHTSPVELDSTGSMDRISISSTGTDPEVVVLVTAGIGLCKVSGENGIIIPGDLLVSSSLTGHAMKETNPQPGTIIGKALDSLTSSTGVIRVLVTLD